MILDVLKKELRSNLSSPKVVITYAVCAILVLGSLVSGAFSYLNLKEESELQQRTEKVRLQTIHNYFLDFYNYGINIFREPDLLSVLVTGVEGDAARRGTTTAFTFPDFNISKFNTTPILAIFGWLDLAFIVKVLLSLFAILFTFDTVSGEKELGTLKLNFTSDLKRSSFLLGKLIGNFILLIVPFAVPVILGLLVIQYIPGIEFSGEDWVRVALIMLAFVLYLLVFFSLGVMVSALTKRPTVSFLILLMIWVLVIVVIPRSAVLVAQTLQPVPPIDEMKKDYVEAYGPKYREFQTRMIEKSKSVKSQLEAQRIMVQELAVFEQEMIKIGKEKMEERDKLQGQQTQLAVSISRYASPAAALTFAVNRLSKTGVESSDEVFKENVKAHQKELLAFHRDLIEKPENINLMNPASTQTKVMDLTPALPKEGTFQKEPFNVSVANSLTDFSVLSFLSILFIAVAFVAFLRYDLR
jgi:ABC-type transport system involved in multi-copper enzyme maturation permease subunit